MIWTIVLVLLGQLIFLFPLSLRFQQNWADNQLSRAHSLVLFLQQHENRTRMSPLLVQSILQSGQFNSIIVREFEDDIMLRSLMIGQSMLTGYHLDFIDRNQPHHLVLLWAMLERADDQELLQISGVSPLDQSSEVLVQLPVGVLSKQLRFYSVWVLFFSFMIVLIVTVGMFWVIHRRLVQPMRQIIRNMQNFHQAPEQGQIIMPSSSTDEVGLLQSSLHEMQSQLSATLKRQNRLALLGGMVARVNHDLRSILATAHLLVQRLELSNDSKVQKAAPTIVSSLDRAALLCEQTLEYVHTPEPMTQRELVQLKPLLDELATGFEGRASLVYDVSHHDQLYGNETLLYRIFLNLARNAIEAGATSIRVTCSPADEASLAILVADNGPGIPPGEQSSLFQPFSSSARGSGLGLTIAREAARHMGGQLDLEQSSSNGTIFRLVLPYKSWKSV
ncbi:MAG: HAMP domain-containing sensor histidine kinase [Pseudomonadota bacterium]